MVIQWKHIATVGIIVETLADTLFCIVSETVESFRMSSVSKLLGRAVLHCTVCSYCCSQKYAPCAPTESSVRHVADDYTMVQLLWYFHEDISVYVDAICMTPGRSAFSLSNANSQKMIHTRSEHYLNFYYINTLIYVYEGIQICLFGTLVRISTTIQNK